MTAKAHQRVAKKKDPCDQRWGWRRAKRERAERARAFRDAKICPECGAKAMIVVTGSWGEWHLLEACCESFHYWARDLKTDAPVLGLGYRMDRRTGLATDLPTGTEETGRWIFDTDQSSSIPDGSAPRYYESSGIDLPAFLADPVHLRSFHPPVVVSRPSTGVR